MSEGWPPFAMGMIWSMQADSGCGYFKEKSTGLPQIPQTVWVAYIFFLLIRNCCWCEPLRSGLGIGIRSPSQRKSDRKMQPPLWKYYKEFCKCWSRSERWLALDLHTPREARKLGGGSNIMCWLFRATNWPYGQNASSCTHVLHSPLRGLENWRWLHESTSLRYIYTFLSLNYSTPKTNKTNTLDYFFKYLLTAILQPSAVPPTLCPICIQVKPFTNLSTNIFLICLSPIPLINSSTALCSRSSRVCSHSSESVSPLGRKPSMRVLWGV